MSSSDMHELTGLYVDVENLKDDAHDIVSAMLKEWPLEKVPIPSLVNLYVPADTVELWKIWASDFSTTIQFNVCGIQHYTVGHSKNSADLNIAVDALADLFKGRVNHVAVCSDDSDFISLIAKIRDEDCAGSFPSKSEAKFLWILTGRTGTKTPNLDRFLPERFLHVMDGSFSWNKAHPNPESGTDVAQVQRSPEATKRRSDTERIVLAIVSNVAVGPFKATVCKPIVQEAVPNSKMGKLPDNQFGKQFVDNIWPELEKIGVKLKSTKPNRFEMTQEAKATLD